MNSLLANLNSVDPPMDYGNGGPRPEDLSIFANTEFFDFDAGRNTDLSVDEMLMHQEKHLQEKRARSEGTSSQTQQHPQQGAASTSASAGSSSIPGLAQIDFQGLGQFSLAEGLPSHQNGYQHAGNNHHFPPTAPANTPVSNSQSDISAIADATPVQNDAKKRKTSQTTSVVAAPIETAASTPSESGATRVAAEEDKRRRNTAASARFRIKKKQREQEMEKNARELQEKVDKLESKVTQLEMENKWLRNLVVEKNEARDVSSLLDMKNRVVADAKSNLEPIKPEEKNISL